MSQSTEKSLGQVLYEAFRAHAPGTEQWAALPASTRREFEVEAQAVAAAVREQCAQVCDRYARTAASVMNEDAADAGEYLAKEIRSMK